MGFLVVESRCSDSGLGPRAEPLLTGWFDEGCGLYGPASSSVTVSTVTRAYLLRVGGSVEACRGAFDELRCDRERSASVRPLLLAGLTMGASFGELIVELGERSHARLRGLGSLMTKPPAVIGASSSWGASSGGSGSGRLTHRPSGPLVGRIGRLPFLLREFLGIIG